MSSFIRTLKEDPKNQEKSNEMLFNELYELINKNARDKIAKDNSLLNNLDNEIYENNLLIVANGLFSESFSSDEEESKRKLLSQLRRLKGMNVKIISERFKKYVKGDMP